MTDKEIKALISLLDDDDKQVSSHVEEKLLSLGSEAIPFLEHEWENNLNPAVQGRIEDMIHKLQYELISNRLKQWYKDPEHDLITGMWIIATYQYPDLELSKLKQELEQIYYETWLDFRNDLLPLDRIKIINNVLFNKLKFGANTKNFHSPGNSMLNIVLESRRGNPITLSIIYMLVAQKLKMPIQGVNLPNLFVLTYKDEAQQLYINPFNKGLIFSRQDIENYIKELHLAPQPSFFEPCTNIEIVRRSLRNLVMSFEKMGEHAKAEEVKLLLVDISDGGDLGV
jgi:regulator of sirC expression with transglutaminase-like and TPR domain